MPTSAPELCPPQGWNMPELARLRAPAPAARGLLFRSLSFFSGLFGRSAVPDVLTVLHLNPRLFWAWLFFASRLMPYGRLPATERELVILRTAWNCRSRYEWGQHVDIGLQAGLQDADIVRITQGPQAFSEDHLQALVQACDDLHATQCIGTATWTRLRAHYSEALLVEIVMLIGHYAMIAGFLNSAGLELEPDIEAQLQSLHHRLHTA